MKRCPLVKLEEACDRDTRAELKRQRLWRGEPAFRALLGVYDRVSQAIESEGGEFNAEWPYRTAMQARIILTARAQVRSDAMTPPLPPSPLSV